jgi:glycosyltransferase involved in cell wall biosynthesis
VRLASFVIPTLREDQIEATLSTLCVALSAIEGYRFELLLADDSPEPYKRKLDDALVALEQRFAPQVTGRRVDGPRRGKGAAVRAGVASSRGETVFLMDADLPVPLKYVAIFLRRRDEGFEAVVAERPFRRNYAQPVRFAASLVLFALQRVFVFHSAAFSDTQCGFKAFGGDFARGVARDQIVDGGMVDIEYLYAAFLAKARISRVSVPEKSETRASKINVGKAMRGDPLDLLRIKWNGMRGGYAAGVRRP